MIKIAFLDDDPYALLRMGELIEIYQKEKYADIEYTSFSSSFAYLIVTASTDDHGEKYFLFSTSFHARTRT